MTNQDVKRILKISALSILFIFIIVYSFFNARGLIFGVRIKNVNLERKVDDNNVVKITGNAKNAKNISLNGRNISIDQTGKFDETIILLPGYNIIDILATDKFGYKDEKNYQLIGK